jgi:replicative DNA helicase
MDMIYGYYDDFKEAPRDNFSDLFKEREDSINEDLHKKCLNIFNILNDITGSNGEYILQRINDAIYHFQLEEASIEFASSIKSQKYNDAIAIILKAIKKQNVIDDPYYSYFTDKSFIEERISDKRYLMQTKIKMLDTIIGGFQTNWLVTCLGATKVGKTWMLIELALVAVWQGLNVLFVSLEMGKAQIDERLDMAVGFMTSNPDGQAEMLRKVGDDYIKVNEKADTIYEIDKVIKARNKYKKISGGHLEVVAFNRGRLNYLDIDRILDELEEKKGLFFDAVVVDYLGIMKETAPGQNKKEKISENSIGLKEIAGTRNMLTISAMQGNRKAMSAKIFKSNLVADDIDTIFNSDLVLAICQTDIEEKEGKARIYIANYRHGKQHGSIGIYRDLSIGQFSIDNFEIKDVTPDEEKEAGVDY